ncbi:MAG: CPBP family intramembrane metalloprotease [Asgard group archaeon]|nr:CPBP family intramembrane metalloprotease [Asgard group archaeon]
MSDDEEKKPINAENSLYEKDDEEQLSEDSWQYCQKCQKKNPKNNLFCNFCGHHFVDKIKCQKCSEMMPIYNSFCGNCGAPLKIDIQSKSFKKASSDLTEILQQPTLSTSEQVNKPINYQMKITEYERRSKIQTRQTTATIFGIIFLVFGIGNLIVFILQLGLFSSEYMSELLELYELDFTNDVTIYAGLVAFQLPPIVILVVSGISLMKPKNKNKPWKSLYHTLRFVFIGFSTIIALFCVIASFGWIFYNPTIPYLEIHLLWMFTAIEFFVTSRTLLLYSLLFVIYFITVILLILPPILELIKNKMKKKVESEDEEVVKSSEEGKSIELDNDNRIIFKSKNEEILAVKERKGPMPAIFYKIKNTPLIKSMELIGAEIIVSFIIVLILGSFATDDTPDVGVLDPFNYIIQLAWAGVFEELSFRLVLIGIPMIIVVIVRFVLQKKYEDKPNDETKLTKRIKDQPKLNIKDILFAFRGKYKIISYPEWVLVGISSILFGFAHWEGWTGGWGWWKIIQTAASGFFLSYAFVKYGIESAIFIHITNNVISGLTLFSTDIPNASWLIVFSTIATFSFIFLGIMKITSYIINLVYRYRIIKIPEYTY